jgi:hypothetical protein
MKVVPRRGRASCVPVARPPCELTCVCVRERERERENEEQDLSPPHAHLRHYPQTQAQYPSTRTCATYKHTHAQTHARKSPGPPGIEYALLAQSAEVSSKSAEESSMRHPSVPTKLSRSLSLSYYTSPLSLSVSLRHLAARRRSAQH